MAPDEPTHTASQAPPAPKEPFFTRDKSFYRSLIPLAITISLQNLVAYSVNMADNVMLGSYAQSALSGAAIVNQIFFVVQMIAIAIGEGVTIIGAQYWGQRRLSPIRRLCGIALKFGAICGVAILIACAAAPWAILTIFTSDAEILAQGVIYLDLIKYTFLLFIITNVLMSALRCVETVRISFYVSVVSLFINVGINYTLIFGKFGLPELGIKGAAIGTLTARIAELAIVVVYLKAKDTRLELFSENFLARDKGLTLDFVKVELPTMTAQLLWGLASPIQTAVLGHLTSDAIAANSVCSTFYNYLKMVVAGSASGASVVMGAAVGRGNLSEIKAYARTLQLMFLGLGLCLGAGLFVLRLPLLSLYSLTPEAMELSNQMIMFMSLVMVTTGYHVGTSNGVIRGGGDARFAMVINFVGTWCMVVPLSLAAAFLWSWPVMWVVVALQHDQLIKPIPVFLWVKSGRWIKYRTR